MNNLLKKLGLLVLSVLVVLGMLEVVLRRVPPVSRSNPTADRSPVFFGQAQERAHPWVRGTNAGLRVAVIGDSFTAGVGVQKLDTYGARLEQLLNLNDGVAPARVEIQAQAGTSTFQQRKLLRAALEGNPDLVILGICLNDAEDWTHPKRIQRWRDEWMSPAPSAFSAFCQRHSRVAALVASRLWVMGSGRRCVEYYRHLYDPEGAGLIRFRQAMAFFRDECAQRDIAFVPVIFPLLSFDFSPESYPMGFAHEAIHSICQDLGIPVLDLLPYFENTDPVRMQAVPGIDPHPSEIAHRIAAETILRHLLNQGVIPAAYQPPESRANDMIHEIWRKTIRRTGAGGE